MGCVAEIISRYLAGLETTQQANKQVHMAAYLRLLSQDCGDSAYCRGHQQSAPGSVSSCSLDTEYPVIIYAIDWHLVQASGCPPVALERSRKGETGWFERFRTEIGISLPDVAQVGNVLFLLSQLIWGEEGERETVRRESYIIKCLC